MTASKRPSGVTALAVFFAAGATIAAVCGVSLAIPGGPLEPIWHLNPRAREAFAHMAPWGVPLMAVVAAACALASRGLFERRRWGYRLAVGLLVTNLAGDLANVLLGIEPRAAAGVPAVVLLLFYLSRPAVRSSFPKG